MSDTTSTSTGSPEHDLPGFEPWLRMLAASCIPLFVAALLPRSFLLPLAAVAVAMGVAAAVMVVRQERRKRERRRSGYADA